MASGEHVSLTMPAMERLFGWLVLPVLLVGVIALVTPVTPHELGFDEDGHYYGAMTLYFSGKLDPQISYFAHRAPYSARILTPWLAALLPTPVGATHTPPLDAMRLTNLTLCAATLAVLFESVRRLAASTLAAILAQLLYAGVFWTIKFTAYSPAYIDAGMQLFIVLALSCISFGRYWMLVIVFTLAAIQKETTLFLLPVAVIAAWRAWSAARPKFAVWTIVVVLAPLSALLLAARVLPSTNQYSGAKIAVAVLTQQLAVPASWPILLVEIFSGLGLLPLLVLTFWRPLIERLRKEPHWALALLIALAAPLGGVDKARLLLPAAAVLTALLAIVILSHLLPLNPTRAAWLVIVLVLHGYIGHQFEPLESYENYVTRMAPISAVPPRLSGVVLVRVVGVAIAYGLATAGLQPHRAIRPSPT